MFVYDGHEGVILYLFSSFSYLKVLRFSSRQIHILIINSKNISSNIYIYYISKTPYHFISTPVTLYSITYLSTVHSSNYVILNKNLRCSGRKVSYYWLYYIISKWYKSIVCISYVPTHIL